MCPSGTSRVGLGRRLTLLAMGSILLLDRIAYARLYHAFTDSVAVR